MSKWGTNLALAVMLGTTLLSQDTIRVQVQLVLVHATVTDAKGRFVTDLDRGDFTVFENDKSQPISLFASEDTPLSIGIVFDLNGVVERKTILARQTALAFLKAGNVNNEYCVIETGGKPEVTENFTSDLNRLANRTHFLARASRNQSLDAIETGLQKLRNAPNPRKVLLVLTSGGESKSQADVARVRDLARQLDVQIFGIAIPEPDLYGDHNAFKKSIEIVESVGGEGFTPDVDSADEMASTSRKIAVALRNQYVLGYVPLDSTRDGKYRRFQVRLNLPDVPEVFVHTRDGYYALQPDKGPQR